ncbi:MAG: PA14 domain-containing protein [Sedimentisphaerales bacterium]
MCGRSIRLSFLVAALGLFLAGSLRAADPDLVGHWRFDEGSGTVAYDSSGHGNDGVFNGDPQWVDGKFGGALEFDGSGDILDCGNDASLEITDAVTMTAWIKLNGVGLDQKVGGNQDGANGGYKMTVYNTDVVEFEIRTAANASALNRNVAGGTTMQAGEWYHVAGEYSLEGGYIRTYVNGALDRELTTTEVLGASPGNFYVGCEPFNTGAYNFNGDMDDLRLYSRALTETEINGVMMGGGAEYPFASSPDPANGALHADTWVTLSWRAGDFAVSHDVYLSDSLDDVNDGSADAFRGNQTDTYYVAGFPGFAYPDGLVPGTTYYWRIDEINTDDPNSPWAGPIWSFTVPPKKAYDPIPGDGGKFVDAADLTLSWTPGFGAKLHTVYFGDDLDTVSNATGGAPGSLTTYEPGPLEPEKTYYWRVDEFDGAATHTGDVWSFTTAGEGGGVRGDYYQGMNFESLVLTRTDPQINFNWGDPGSPDPAVPVDQFSARWTGEVEAAFTETYTFYTTSDDGARLWINGVQLVDSWIDQGATEHSGKIDLVAGNTYSLKMEYYENGGGAVAELRWSSPHTPKQLIPQAALSLPVKAASPYPTSGATGASLMPILKWTAGESAASHEVYFGTDAEAVANATKASPEFEATKALGDESYDPGKLAWDTTYYWRVDEVNSVNPDSPWVGNVWTFTTGNFLLVDDFESYTDDDDAGEAIWQTWIDGFGVAGNGSQVGYLLPPYAERTIVHSGSQSMPLMYANEAGVTNSEAALALTWPRDWTEEGVADLSLWYRGDAANAADPLYVAVSNASGAPAVVTNADPAAAQTDAWTQWIIPLQSFEEKGIKQANVDQIALGLGRTGGASAGGSGTVYIDDIRLYRPDEAAAQ